MRAGRVAIRLPEYMSFQDGLRTTSHTPFGCAAFLFPFAAQFLTRSASSVEDKTCQTLHPVTAGIH